MHLQNVLTILKCFTTYFFKETVSPISQNVRPEVQQCGVLSSNEAIGAVILLPAKV